MKAEGYTYRRAELEFGVPKSTIRDRISGKTLPGATSGPERYLTDTEEQELVHFIKECAKVGYAKTRKQIIAIVELVLKEKRGPDTSITPGWWYSFKGRHPELQCFSRCLLPDPRAEQTGPAPHHHVTSANQ